MRRLLHAALVAGLLLSIGAPRVGAAVFGTPTVFEAGRSWGLSLAASTTGEVAAVWQTPAGVVVARHADGRWRLDTLGGPRGFGSPLVGVTPGGGTTVALESADARGMHQITLWRAGAGEGFSPASAVPSGSTLRGGWIRPELTVTKGGRTLLTWTRRAERHAGDVMLAAAGPDDRAWSEPRRIGRGSADGRWTVAAGSGAIVTWLSGRHRSGPESVRSLLARRLDSRGRPVGPRSTVAGAATPAAVMAGRPGGEVVTAWSAYDRRARRNPLRACRLVGTPVRCARLVRLAADVGPNDRPSVAVGPGSRAAVAWIAPVTADRAAEPLVAMLTRDGRWTAARDLPGEPRSRLWPPALLPAVNGTFLVAEGEDVHRLGPAGMTGTEEELVDSPPTGEAVTGAAGGGALAVAMVADAYLSTGYPAVWLGTG